MEYKILDAYRNKTADTLGGLIGLCGLVALVVGAVTDSYAISIAGGAGLGSSVLAEGISYAEAYLEATLDYKANNRFTKLEE